MSRVMAADACPSIRCTAFTFAPADTARLAAVCRRSCGVVRTASARIEPGRRGEVAAQPSAGAQVELPFTGLKGPSRVAVDFAGNIYVADSDDSGNNRVLKLPAGSNSQVELRRRAGEATAQLVDVGVL
jgi:NHL repeat